MGMRPSVQTCSGTIDRYLGTSYDNVAVVAENIEDVIKVADSIDVITELEESIGFVLNYLGSSETSPTERLNGDSLESGDYYLNTTDDSFYYLDSDLVTWIKLDIEGAIEAANKAEQAVTDIDALTGQQTTTELINSSTIYDSDKILETSGFLTSGDGGAGKWKQNGVTGQTPSQTPAQLGDGLLNDSNGNQWALVVSESVNVKLLGAVGDGVTDDSAPFQAALDCAVSIGTNLYIPSGRYLFPPINSNSIANVLFPQNTDLDICIYGEGNSTVLVSQDVINSGASYTALFANADGLTPSIADKTRGGNGIVKFRDFAVEGAWRTDYFDTASGRFGKNLFGFQRMDEISFERLEVKNWNNKFSRGGFHKKYTAIYNKVVVCASDVFRAQETTFSNVSFNYVKNADDDAIALHSENGTDNTNSASSMIVIGNIIEDSESIICLGAKLINISNNIVSRSHGTCIYAASYKTGTEGASPSHSVIVSNNIITDPMVRASNGVAGVTQNTQAAITVGASYVSDPNSLGFVPGRPNADGDILPPYNAIGESSFMYTPNYKIEMSSGGYGVNVTGNVIQRTLPSINYNEWGYGMYIDRYGAWNVPVTDESFLYSGILVYSDINNANISNNTITSMGQNGIRLSQSNDLGDDPLLMGLLNITISDNNILDCSQGVMTSVSEASTARNWTVNVTGNTIDCDPYMKHPDRNELTGGWNSTSSINTRCIAICPRKAGAWTVSNNVMKNCYTPIMTPQSALSADTNYVGQDNVIFCMPSVVGFSTDNLGVGEVPYGNEATAIVQDCDVTSSTYGAILTTPKKYSGAMPSSGTYVEGFSIERTNVGATNNTVSGWVRLTTGSDHVYGVDWISNGNSGVVLNVNAGMLQDATNSVNTNSKIKGRHVYDVTTGRPVYATGGLATDDWEFSDATTAYTPT